jgi:hypothetical protein
MGPMFELTLLAFRTKKFPFSEWFWKEHISRIVKRYVCRHPPNLLRGKKKIKMKFDNSLVFLSSNTVHIADKIEVQKAEI